MSSVQTHPFKPYKPTYNFSEYLVRLLAILKALIGTVRIIAASRLKLQSQNKAFGASLEITDKCNAGCTYCYVYPPEWGQDKRVKGYLSLDSKSQKDKSTQLRNIIDKIYDQGKVHITLVGGEPTLAPELIEYAACKFPIVWVVSNGSKSLPKTVKSVVYFVSVDGPPSIHNSNRDPMNFFGNHKYKKLNGLSAAIVRNINESDRGAFVHITLNKTTLQYFTETVHWLCHDVTKLRGIVVSGAATNSVNDPFSLLPSDRLKLKRMIEDLADIYGWQLFPFNKPAINSFLFEPEHIITSAQQCTVARRVDSFNFSGESTGKCILRDQIDCQTCVCNISGLMRGVSSGDLESLKGVFSTCFG